MDVINNLLFEFNKYEYENNEVYITVGIRNGITYRDFAKNDDVKFTCNRAFGNVLFNYYRMIDDQFHFSYDVLRTASIISCQCKTEDFPERILYILERLFHLNFQESLFLSAKEKSKSNFESRYKDESFRAWYKALEITDSNKGFFLDEFLDDILSLDFETFVSCAKNLLQPKNVYIYVNGNIIDLSNEVLESIKTVIPVTDDCIAPVSRRFDPYLRQDAHIAGLARENHNLSILYFDFLNSEATNTTRYFILSVLSMALPFEDVEVAVDSFDASLVFENEYLLQAKKLLQKPLDEESYHAAREKLMARFEYLFVRKPVIFGSDVVYQAISEIYYLDFLSLVDTCSYEKFSEIYSKAQLKVSEAQIVFTKEL